MNGTRSLLSLLAFALGGCGTTLTGAELAPTMTNHIAIRQTPFTPDSGSIAVLCGKLVDGSGSAPFERALVVIRDGRVTSVSSNAATILTSAPCLRRTISQCERLFRQAFDESPRLRFAALNRVSHVPRSGRAGPGTCESGERREHKRAAGWAPGI